MDYSEKKLRQVNRYDGIVVDVTLDQAELPDGRTCFREVVHHPGGVGILPVDGGGAAFCVRQYRYPFSEHLLEIPAGKLEPGEEPLACAVRELSEETGFAADELIDLGDIYTSPGFSTEILHLYLALGLHPGRAHLDPGEFLDVIRLPFAELHRRVLAGELSDGKTVVAVLKAAAVLRERATDPESKS